MSKVYLKLVLATFGLMFHAALAKREMNVLTLQTTSLGNFVLCQIFVISVVTLK
jgi:hypothetical protein